MRYNKRKLNFMIFFTIFLICITVGLGATDFSGSIGSSDAEQGGDIVDDGGVVLPPDDGLFDDVDDDSQGGSDENGGGQTSNNPQNIPELTRWRGIMRSKWMRNIKAMCLTIKQ